MTQTINLNTWGSMDDKCPQPHCPYVLIVQMLSVRPRFWSSSRRFGPSLQSPNHSVAKRGWRTGHLTMIGRLRAHIRTAQLALSSSPQATLVAQCSQDGFDYSCSLVRMTLEKCMRSCEVDTRTAGDVILACGSARIPLLQSVVQGLLNVRDVVRGSALAASVKARIEDFLLGRSVLATQVKTMINEFLEGRGRVEPVNNDGALSATHFIQYTLYKFCLSVCLSVCMSLSLSVFIYLFLVTRCTRARLMHTFCLCLYRKYGFHGSVPEEERTRRMRRRRGEKEMV